MNLTLWFPTPIFWYDLPNSKELNKYLIKHIKEWHKKDKKGVQMTNRGGWHSAVNMNNKKEYEPLVKELLNAQKKICEIEQYTSKMGLGNMWANINYPGCYNKEHMHPNCNWSGAYYIQTPKNCGRLTIHDPRHGANMVLAKQAPLKELKQRCWRQANYIPIEGRMILFPAYLSHHVNMNESKLKGIKGWRISVSFNFIQQ